MSIASFALYDRWSEITSTSEWIQNILHGDFTYWILSALYNP